MVSINTRKKNMKWYLENQKKILICHIDIYVRTKISERRF